MTDLRNEINGLLAKKQTHLRDDAERPQLAQLDGFLQEAYRIVSNCTTGRLLTIQNEHIRSLHVYLLSIRRSYLSNVPPSAAHRRRMAANEPVQLADKDKDAVDASCRSLLRDLTASVTQLASAATVRHETAARQIAARYKTSLLGKWATGNALTNPQIDSGTGGEQRREEAELNTLRQVHESVVWYLSKKVEGAGQMQQSMMERRLERAIEKQRSMLHKVGYQGVPKTSTAESPTSSDNPLATSRAAMLEHDKAQVEQQLSPEQVQMFAEENQGMLKRYEDTLDHVRWATLLRLAKSADSEGRLNDQCWKFRDCKASWCKI